MIRNSKHFEVFREQAVGASLKLRNVEPIFELWAENIVSCTGYSRYRDRVSDIVVYS